MPDLEKDLEKDLATLTDMFQARLQDAIGETSRANREQAMVRTKLDEAILWARRAVEQAAG